MTLTISAASPMASIPSALVPPKSANTDAMLAPQISRPPDGGASTGSPAGSAEPFGLTTGDNTAEALRKQAVLTAANTIHWTPWQRAYSPDQKGPGTWINLST
jgi:hypothetical protein